MGDVNTFLICIFFRSVAGLWLGCLSEFSSGRACGSEETPGVWKVCHSERRVSKVTMGLSGPVGVKFRDLCV